MGQIQQSILTPTDRSGQAYGTTRYAMGAIFTNETPFYTLVRLGGSDQPSNIKSATLTIAPYHEVSTPLASPDMAFYWTSDPFNIGSGTQLGPQQIGGGYPAFTVTIVDTPTQRNDTALANAAILSTPGNIGQSFPYTFVGTVQFPGNAMAAIDCSGWTCARFYAHNLDPVLPARVEILFDFGNGINDGLPIYNILLPPNCADFLQIPLPYITHPQQIPYMRAIPTVYTCPTATKGVLVIPMLTLGGEFIPGNYKGAYLVEGDRVTVPGPGVKDVVAGPVHIYGVSLTGSLAPVALTQVQAYTHTSPLGAAKITVLQLPVTVGNFDLNKASWQTENFNNAVPVALGDALAMASDAAITVRMQTLWGP